MPKIIENLRERIIEEGKSILVKGRYADFNVRIIAKRCGIGIGTVYNYFSSKEELALEIFKNDWEKTLWIVDSLKSESGELKSKLYKVYCSLEGFMHSYMSIFLEMASQKGQKSSGPHEYYRQVYVKMEELIKAEKKGGQIRTDIAPDKLACFIISNMVGCIKNNYMSFDELYECMKL